MCCDLIHIIADIIDYDCFLVLMCLVSLFGWLCLDDATADKISMKTNLTQVQLSYDLVLKNWSQLNYLPKNFAGLCTQNRSLHIPLSDIDFVFPSINWAFHAVFSNFE